MSAPELDPVAAIAHLGAGIDHLREIERSRVGDALLPTPRLAEPAQFSLRSLLANLRAACATAALVGVLI